MAKKKSTETLKLRKSKITFDDVVGHKPIKKRLKSIISILKKPEVLERFETPPPRGMLLYGPASVGKSMLAKAFAHEAKVPYIDISGSKLFDMEHIREAYGAAAKAAPSIVILEDIDLKGIIHGTLTNVSFADIAKIIESSDPGVFTIATAEMFESVDSVLTAPQKLDFLIEVSKLDKDARRFFIEKIMQKPHDPTIDVERIVHYIAGMSAMELDRLGRMAALSAIEQGKNEITESMLIEQINIIKYGHKVETHMVKNLEEELEMTAYHEAAHAVLSCLLLPHIKIEQVTISRRSKTLGFVSYDIDDQMTNITKEELFHDVCVLLAGRIAKIKKAGDRKMDSGAASDLQQASLQVYAAITSLGMDRELGFINLESIAMMDNLFLQEQIEKRFALWMKSAREQTEALVEAHWEKIEKLAQELRDKEVVEGSRLAEIIGDEKIRSDIPDTL